MRQRTPPGPMILLDLPPNNLLSTEAYTVTVE
jgi:hypothetical protein